MEVRFHRSVDEFRAVAEPVYRRDPVAHTIELTLLRAGTLPGDSLLLTLWHDGTIFGAALQTPPYPLAGNMIPIDTVELVAAEVAEARPDLAGIRADRDTAHAFARAWRDLTGRHGVVELEERLYRLAELHPPTGVAGATRPAGDGDRAVLTDWFEQFLVEAFGHPRDDAAGAAFLDEAAVKGDEFVLWDLDGAPVSMAMVRAPAAGVSRIGPVFTPEDRRGQGFGSAVTAAAARSALDTGVDDVVLFTDLANPTSNAIYRRIGFEPVTDFTRVSFRAVD
ncbi:GNAT family N-acetyltransferase [Mycobacterium sp. B14F4]|uniref:GNAT family N-acetyltransferase n=1 Tax=Mycobacterium sp. B14F4 TaxID=3153565 RepID=UPI00325F0775